MDHKLAAAIYHSKPKSQDSIIESSSNNKDGDSEYLIKKVKALQLIPYFEDIDPRNLKNIAANI